MINHVVLILHETLAARGRLEEHMQITLIFARIISLMISVTLAYVLYFKEFQIHDSHRFTIFKE